MTKEKPMDFPQYRQQARQMDDFAQCILESKESRVSGDMGMRDVQIMMAIYQSAMSGERIELQLERYEQMIEY